MTSSQPLVHPGRFEKATDAQVNAIRRMTIYKAKLSPWHRHDDDEIIENLNDLLRVDLSNLENLTRREASTLISKLSA